MTKKKVKKTPRVGGKATEFYFRADDGLTNEIKGDAKNNFGGNQSLAIRSRLSQFFGLK